MPSVTHAMKGQKVLQHAGLRSEIDKAREPEGCVYRLLAAAPAQQVLSLLDRNSVPYLSVTES